MQSIAALALAVPDFDEAIHYDTKVLGFELCEDRAMAPGKRWVTVAPRGGSGPRLLLARAANEAQASRIGNQSGRRVFLFLHTDDFQRDHAAYRAAASCSLRHRAKSATARWPSSAIATAICGI